MAPPSGANSSRTKDGAFLKKDSHESTDSIAKHQLSLGGAVSRLLGKSQQEWSARFSSDKSLPSKVSGRKSPAPPGALVTEPLAQTHENEQALQEELWQASEAGDRYMLMELVDKLHVDVNAVNAAADSWTALHYAVNEGKLKCVEFLLLRGA